MRNKEVLLNHRAINNQENLSKIDTHLIKSSKYINLKLTELKREIDRPIITVKISTLLLIIDRTHRGKNRQSTGS